MIRIPENVKITEWPASTTWLNNEIYYSVYKKGATRSIQESTHIFEEFKKDLNDKKICLMMDITQFDEASREVRNYAATGLQAIIKMIPKASDSSPGKILVNLFITLKTQLYPAKMFSMSRAPKHG